MSLKRFAYSFYFLECYICSHNSSFSSAFKIASWNVAGLRALVKKQPDALKDLVKEYGKHHFVLIWIDFLSPVQQLIISYDQ